MKIKSLLITAIGGDIAQSTARIIKQHRPDIRLIGVDATKRHAGSIFVDDFRVIVKAGHENYLKNIQELIKEFNIDVLLPMSETELGVYAKIEDKINNCLIIHCGHKGLNIGLDKLKTNQFLQSINALYPWTVLVSEASDVEMPCILKPKTGSGSKGIRVVECQQDFNYFKYKYPHYIFQELLTPNTQEITCAVYRSKEGNIYILQMLRELTGGTTGWAKVVNYKDINELCAMVVEKLDVYGCFNIQMINTKNGAYIFEINPRVSSTVAMRAAIGFTDIMWMINEAEGQKISNTNIVTNKILVKTCSVEII